MEYSTVKGTVEDGGWSSLSGNFNKDPRFLNTETPQIKKQYYVPRPGSIAEDNAKEDPINSRNEDKAGTRRPQGQGYDIGCYEAS